MPIGADGEMLPFVEGKVYHRQKDIHKKYGGSAQSGIAPCAKHPFIFLFQTPSGKEAGYTDGWRSNDIFEYTGQGQRGDMQFILGNRAIRDHKADGKQLHLFKKVNSGFYEYIGQFTYQSYVIENGYDFEHHPRKVIRFTLKKV